MKTWEKRHRQRKRETALGKDEKRICKLCMFYFLHVCD